MTAVKHLFIITGGSKGLGAALIKQLDSDNNVVYSISRSQPSAKCLHIKADLSKHQQVDIVMEQIFSNISILEFQSITLINNAGILGPIGKIEYTSKEEILLNLNTNFTAPISLTARLIEICSEHDVNKTVITISSGAATNPYDGWSLYCGSKAGLEHFARCVAKEQSSAKYPVSVVNVNPGVMDTDMQASIRTSSLEEFSSLEKFLNLHKNKQLPSPDKVAFVILKALREGMLVSGETFKVADWL